jgi:hypothetical protein
MRNCQHMMSDFAVIHDGHSGPITPEANIHDLQAAPLLAASAQIWEAVSSNGNRTYGFTGMCMIRWITASHER